MGLHHGAEITNTGMIACWDPGNVKSYYNNPAVTLYDISNNGNHANLNTSATMGPMMETGVGHIIFNGTSDYLPTTTLYNPTPTTSFTLNAWFKISSGGGKMIGFEDTQTGLPPTPSSTADRHLYIGATDGKLYFGVGSTAQITSTAAVRDGQWHMATGTYDGTTIRLYVDGALVSGPTSATALTYASGGYWRMGGYKLTPNAPDGYYSGILGHTMIYNRALSDAEILNCYHALHGRYDPAWRVYTKSEYLTSGTGIWQAPAPVIPNSATRVMVEAVGGGGAGLSGLTTPSFTARYGGGGGGAYSKNMLTLKSTDILYYSIGASNTNTWASINVNSVPTSTAAGILAKSGNPGVATALAPGGTFAASIGLYGYDGGAGYSGGGGGGGVKGIGGRGGASLNNIYTTGFYPGGGGGGGGGSTGGDAVEPRGGAGGNNYLGVGGGVSIDSTGTSGIDAYAGGGGAGDFGGNGASGSAGVEWDGLYGSGGGGAGGSATTNGGNGGLGGGGGGGGNVGGLGGVGILRLTYVTAYKAAADDSTVAADWLVVGGGGGGGAPGSAYGGGGGGGAVVPASGTLIRDTTYSVTIGSSGIGANYNTSTAATQGGSSNFGAFTTATGGFGAVPTPSFGIGGASGNNNTGGINGRNAGGGGGGAGGSGISVAGTSSYGGAGGPGITSSLTGSTYGGGGGGAGSISGSGGSGGSGGGGRGEYNSATSVAANGTPNTGGGGGGGNRFGGYGGSGVVVIRLPSAALVNMVGGGVITASSGGYTTYTFTSNGTFTYIGTPAS